MGTTIPVHVRAEKHGDRVVLTTTTRDESHAHEMSLEEFRQFIKRLRRHFRELAELKWARKFNGSKTINVPHLSLVMDADGLNDLVLLLDYFELVADGLNTNLKQECE